MNETKLLDVKLVEENSTPSRFTVSTKPDMTIAFLGFDFVDKDQGAVVQVIHTGNSATDVCLKGTIKGAGTPRHNPLHNSSNLLVLMQIIAYFGSALGISLVGILIGSYAIKQFVLQSWIVILFMAVFTIIGFRVGIYLLRKFDSWSIERIPNDLRSHF